MMLFKSKKYPCGKYQLLFLTGNFWKRFKIGKGIGFWKHPTFVVGSYAEWTLRFIFIEIKKWLSENENRIENKK